jgi:hypothetical protein
LQVDAKVSELRGDQRITPQGLNEAVRTLNEELNR